MKKQFIKPCAICGSTRIDIKREIITPFEIGDDKVRVWAFCRNCGQRGLSAVGRLTEKEGEDAAIRLWNNV